MTARATSSREQYDSSIRKVTKKWTTIDGRKARMCDMTDSHLLNAIAICQRMHRAVQLDTPYPSLNGEMAQFYAEQDWSSLQDSNDPSDSFPLYDDLCLEARRRRLTLPENGRRKK
jgi:hypothetical protein